MVDETDFKLIRELQHDSRQNYTKMAEKLGLSESTVRRRVTKLAKNNMVTFTIFLNPEALGFPISAVIGCNARPKNIDQIADKLAQIDFLYSVAIVAGRYDIITSGYFKSVDHVYEVIREQITSISGIEKVETLIMLKRKKREY